MCILKKKIALAHAHTQKTQDNIKLEDHSGEIFSTDPSPQSICEKHILERKPIPPRGSTSANNIVKNYGRALMNFALSELARTYLDPMLTEYSIKYEDFISYLRTR